MRRAQGGSSRLCGAFSAPEFCVTHPSRRRLFAFTVRDGLAAARPARVPAPPRDEASLTARRPLWRGAARLRGVSNHEAPKLGKGESDLGPRFKPAAEYALEAPHARSYLHRRRLYAPFAADRICPRHHARGDPRRRSRGGRVLRGAAPAQSFSRDLRRRRLQRGVRAGLCPCPRRRGEDRPACSPTASSRCCLSRSSFCSRSPGCSCRRR